MSRPDRSPGRAHLATIFDEAPTLYARYRPSYPDEAIDALLELAGTPPGGAVLEIGAGPGTLTLPLARAGFAVTALEPGVRTAALLRRRSRDLPQIRVEVSTFEAAPIEPHSFDLVVSATAFHWVDPDRRYRLVADALREGGSLGLIRNDHVLTEANRPYYEATLPFYERDIPDEAGLPPAEDEVAGFAADVAASGLFEVVEQRQFGWSRTFTTRERIGLLRTYSAHRALPRRRAARLLRDVAAVIDERLGGEFVDRYVTTVCVARPIRD